MLSKLDPMFYMMLCLFTLPGIALLFFPNMVVKAVGLVLGCLSVVFFVLHSYAESSGQDAMKKHWESAGCAVCRQAWLDGTGEDLMPKLAVNPGKHSSLRRCPKCNTYWEHPEGFAFANPISCEEAAAKYDLPDKYDLPE
jgi:hypothetical protein